MKKNRIHISIAFGDAILPIIECDDGHQRVPLKPISDQIGLNWASQRQKMKSNDYLNSRLGVKLVPVKGYQDSQKEGGKPQFCIRLDRVTAFLYTLNPENIRGMGNHEAADWLVEKHQEWDDVLHTYENTNGNIKGGATVGTKHLIDLLKVRNTTSNTKEKAGLTLLISQQFLELGVDLNNIPEQPKSNQLELIPTKGGE
ncbi:MAG: phage antirepressor N-terminal domain-containing protein [Candidatus Sedimenticola sp. (ex Thyasira tokunagai)]